MTMGFKEWLISEASASLQKSDNMHLRGDLRAFEVDVSFDEMMDRQKAGKTTVKIRKTVRSEDFFDAFPPGRLAKVNIVGEEKSGESFYSKVQLRYNDLKGWDAWEAARRDFWNDKETNVTLEIPLEAEYRYAPNKTSDDVNHAYLIGYINPKKDWKFRIQPDWKPPMIAAMQRGHYDATHFYPIGESQPNFESVLATSWSQAVPADRAFRGKLIPPIMKLIGNYIDANFDPRYAKFLKPYFNPNEDENTNYNHINRELDDLAAALQRKMIVDKEKVGISGAIKLIEFYLQRIIWNITSAVNNRASDSTYKRLMIRYANAENPEKMAQSDWRGYLQDKKKMDKANPYIHQKMLPNFLGPTSDYDLS